MTNPEMTLQQCLDAEARAVKAGQAAACGEPQFGNLAILCQRSSTHLVDGVLGRESHAVMTTGDPDYTVIADPTTGEDRGWETWTDEVLPGGY
jgi:hypothetical protein